MSLIQKPEQRVRGDYAGTWLADEAGTKSLVLFTGGRGDQSFIGVENPTTGEQRIVTLQMLISYATADGILSEPEAAPQASAADLQAAHAAASRVVDGAATLQASSDEPKGKRKKT